MFYLAVSTGFTVNFHYCFGELSSASLGTPTSCNGGKMKLNRPCCKTTHLIVSIKDKQLSTPAHRFAKLYVADLPAMHYSGLFVAPLQTDIFKNIPNKAPPDGLADPLFLTFRNFRI